MVQKRLWLISLFPPSLLPSSLLCQIWSVVSSPGNMIRRRSVAWSATKASVCVDEDTTAGYVVTSSANSAHLSSLSMKPVRAWKFFCSFSNFLHLLTFAVFQITAWFQSTLFFLSLRWTSGGLSWLSLSCSTALPSLKETALKKAKIKSGKGRRRGGGRGCDGWDKNVLTMWQTHCQVSGIINLQLREVKSQLFL